MEIDRLFLVLAAGFAQLLGHLLHEACDHVNVGDLSIIKVILNLIQILLRQTLIWLVHWSLLLILAWMMKHALLVTINTEAIEVFDAGHVFLKVIQLGHLL